MKTDTAIQSADFTPPSAAKTQSAIAELQALLGQRTTTAEAIREHHSHGESYHPAALPDVVCFPQSTEEVSAIMKISAKYGVPVIPFGGGTSMEAQVNAIYGGITLDIRQMNKILNISVEDLQATVEAGVTRFRPVLMTALAMIIGMVPMALGLGEGGEQNAPLGRAVIGGLLLATAATLVFVPTVFAFIHSRRHGPAAHELVGRP